MSNKKIQDYIDRINLNDETLRDITVSSSEGEHVTDADLASLMAALENNPKAAQRITAMTFLCNRYLSYINIPEVMTSLEHVLFSYNRIISLSIPTTLSHLVNLNFIPLRARLLGLPGVAERIRVVEGIEDANDLSLIAKITLNKFHIDKPGVTISVNFNLDEFTSDKITTEALEFHFRELIALHIRINFLMLQNIREMLVQGKSSSRLPNSLIDMVLGFLSGGLHRLESEITMLKNVFPESKDIISDFKNSNEFKDIEAEIFDTAKNLAGAAAVVAMKKKLVAIEKEIAVLHATNAALDAEAVALQKKRNTPYFIRFVSWIAGIVHKVKSFFVNLLWPTKPESIIQKYFEGYKQGKDASNNEIANDVIQSFLSRERNINSKIKTQEEYDVLRSDHPIKIEIASLRQDVEAFKLLQSNEIAEWSKEYLQRREKNMYPTRTTWIMSNIYYSGSEQRNLASLRRHLKKINPN